MSGIVWYVIHEYAIYDNPDEILHTWKVMGRFESKGKAEREALELAFNEYCKDKPMRFPKNQRNKNDLKLDDKINIVTSVLYNIQQSTNASNKYNGIGFFVINSDDIKINKNVVNISDINKMLKHSTNQQEKEEGQVEEVNEEEELAKEEEVPKQEVKEDPKPLPESKFKEYSDEETEVDKIVREYSQRKDPHISYLESQLKFDKGESETESESEFESESDYSTNSDNSKEESDNESGIE